MSNNNYRRILTTIGALIAIVMVVSIAFDKSLHVFRYCGYLLLMILGISSIYIGRTNITETHVEGEKITWLESPLIRTGLILIFLAILSFCIFDLRSIL